jgi:hypothetical protein
MVQADRSFFSGIQMIVFFRAEGSSCRFSNICCALVLFRVRHRKCSPLTKGSATPEGLSEPSLPKVFAQPMDDI